MIIYLSKSMKNYETIEELKNKYGDKILIIDYFQIKFNVVIQQERIKYNMIDLLDDLNLSYNLFNDYINKIVDYKIKRLIEENENEVILLVGYNKNNSFKFYDVRKLVKEL